MLSYVDARDVAIRLDEVFAPPNWTFNCDVVPGTNVVHGRLTVRVGGIETFREDHGYPNSDDDDEPIKAATSDCFKRCAVQYGIGRHLYSENKPQRPKVAQPLVAPTPLVNNAPAPIDPTHEVVMPMDEPPLFEGEPDGFQTLVTRHTEEMRPAQTPAQAPAQPLAQGICKVHGPMRSNSRGFYCPHKVQGQWCPGVQ
jgi:hypothetical protein